jgi:hypothetical protein
MRVEPGGAELLRVARKKLLEELLARIPEADRYAARMIANAMAIAARELDCAQSMTAEETGRLREADARLAADIRAGRYDAPQESARLLEQLRHDTEQRLAVSNPRILSGKKP